MKPPLHQPVVFTGVLLALLVGAYVVGAAVTVGLFAAVPDSVLFEKGPGKLMRRLVMVLVILGLPWVLRRYAWKGWRDNGWKLAAEGACWRKDLIRGFLIGLVTLGVLVLAGWLVDERLVRPEIAWGMLPVVLVGMVLQGLVVGVLEETLARGILFRSVARMWPVAAAALFSSALFAVGHFLKPQDVAFEAGGGIGPPLWSMVEFMGSVNRIEWRLPNLILMSLALCVVVVRTRTIWLAAGLHAGWVFVKELSDHIWSWDPSIPYDLVWGQRSDFTDGLACMIMLTLVFAWAWRLPQKASASADA